MPARRLAYSSLAVASTIVLLSQRSAAG